MIIEIEDLDFSRYTPAQLAAVRPLVERVADITRRNLLLLDGVLGTKDGEPDLVRSLDLARAELGAALAQIDALELLPIRLDRMRRILPLSGSCGRPLV